MKEKFEQARPYVWGAVIGVVGTVVIAFAAGVVTLTSTAEDRIAKAAQDSRVAVLSAVCAERALVHRQEVGDTQDLRGWQNRQAREALAGQFAAVLAESESDPAVVRACAQLIERQA